MSSNRSSVIPRICKSFSGVFSRTSSERTPKHFTMASAVLGPMPRSNPDDRYGGVQSFSLMRWDNPYKIENISSGTPGRTNPADKPFKPNNVCNAISYRSQVYRLALKMRNAQRINYTMKCTTIYCVCQHIWHYILCLHFAGNFYHGSRRADDAAELPAYSRVSFMYSTSHTKHSLCTLTNACAIAMAIPLFRE